ncbi:MAG: NUDIX hydrolase [Aristaeellaceae bacterium]
MRDILFKEPDFVFSYRVGGILVRDGHVLLQRPDNDEGYAVIGGHVAALETAEDALRREYMEELHAPVAVGPLMAVGENFFPWGQRPCHQLHLYFAVTLLDDTAIPLRGTFHGYDELGGERIGLNFTWVPLTELANLTVYPPQMVQRILCASGDVLHFTYHEQL